MHGTLWIADSKGTKLQPIRSPFSIYSSNGIPVTSSAKSVLNVSSYWGKNTYDYHPIQILKEQDVFTAADSNLAWCPLTLHGNEGHASGGWGNLLFDWNPTSSLAQNGYTEFIELEMGQAGYAISNSLTVGMNRGMGCITSFQLLAPDQVCSMYLRIRALTGV